VRLVRAVQGGMSARAAARLFEVSESSGVKRAQRFRKSGSVKPTGVRGHRRSPLDAHSAWLLSLVEAQPDLTLEEIGGRLRREKGLSVGLASIWRFFERHRITFKKSARAVEQDREDVRNARERWKAQQGSLDPAKLVFLDETGTATNMARLRGRCRRGERLPGLVPHGHWKTTTFVAALRIDAVTAPFVIAEPMNGEILLGYLEKCLVPTLSPGDIVVMDNLAAHKVAGVRELIQATGARLFYLPPYSPDLNPIEQLFAKLKALLRAAAERSIPALWDRIGEIINSISSIECTSYLRHAGYA
jgi:transposase